MSAIVDHPQSARPSIDGLQLGPITLFDRHLKNLSDSYLAFFQERVKIEETYVDLLLRLHRKTKNTDYRLDDGAEPSSVRRVWGEVRDNLEREAQTRQAFLGALTNDVIGPLSQLKETQERTRNRIQDDIKTSTAAYADYAETVLPRLKKTYFKRCQDVEDYKAVVSPTGPQAPMSESLPLTATRTNPGVAPGTVVTGPQPLRPLARRASGHHQTRNRSPSGSNPLQDLASQSKKQFNQIISFLDNKGDNKGGIAGLRGDHGVRSVKAKRDADDADKEYRKGIHWLETLRIRRMKIMEGGFKSLELFIAESGEKVHSVLEKYGDGIIATIATQLQLSKLMRSVMSDIDPRRDASNFANAVPRYLRSSYNPPRTLYVNYKLGECRDIMFGVGLADYAGAKGLVDGQIPKIIKICIQEVEKRGMNSEGIYRISGRHAVAQELMHRIEKDERTFQFNPTDDIFVVASLLKLYLRELPEPVFKFPLEDRIKHSEEIEMHASNKFRFLRGKIRRLPAVHFASLKMIVQHLAHVAANCERNKMDAKNLAIIFGAVIFGEDELPKGGDLLSIHSWKDTLMEDLITYSSELFEDQGANSSPPLPPAPLGEMELPPLPYGSSYTQITTLPPSPAQVQMAQDFTPQLPLRPSSSIHPSRRINVQTSRSDNDRGTTSSGRSDSDNMSSLSKAIQSSGRSDNGHSTVSSITKADSLPLSIKSTTDTPVSMTSGITTLHLDLDSIQMDDGSSIGGSDSHAFQTPENELPNPFPSDPPSPKSTATPTITEQEPTPIEPPSALKPPEKDNHAGSLG